MIKYLKHKDIDKTKWDNTISNSTHPLVYALSWYLDIVSPEWEALIEDNYISVMPLTKGPRFGIRYLRQPFFCQQLGVFSLNEITETLTASFLSHIPAKFKLVDIQLNSKNIVPTKYECNPRTNYILSINCGYEELFKRFSTNTQRNIKKAEKLNLVISSNISSKEFVNFTKDNSNYNNNNINYSILENIVENAIRKKIGKLFSVKKNETIIAVAFFINNKNRWIYLSGTSNSIGFENKAMFLIIEKFIKSIEFSVILDFEGSMLEGVARFYKGFGAKKEKYYHLKINKLPNAVKMIMRNK